MAQKQISQSQYAALRAYAKANGRNWKSKLHGDWLRASYPSVSEIHAPYLQQLRNDPDFNLKTFKLVELDNSEPEMVPVEKWGTDHYSTLGYLECRVVDNNGIPERKHMRTNSHRHPGLAHMVTIEPNGIFRYPSKIKDNQHVALHDDWDCVDDMEKHGLVKTGGTGLHPIWRLTDLGRKVCAELRKHKATGASFGTFQPSPELLAAMIAARSVPAPETQFTVKEAIGEVMHAISGQPMRPAELQA